jgi:hypothetical protein
MKSKSIVMGIAIAVALAACGGPIQLTAAQSNTTQLGALQYAQSDGGKFVSCSGQDSDRDGYVACTIKDVSGTDKAIVCSYEGAPGCKLK